MKPNDSMPEEEQAVKEEQAGDKPSQPQDAPHTGEEHREGKKVAGGMSLIKILGGDILTHNFFRRQILLLVMLVAYAIIYISNRYVCQQQLIEIDALKKKLTEIRYDALTRSSEFTEKSRQSKIEEYISTWEDSQLETSTKPPYLIK